MSVKSTQQRGEPESNPLRNSDSGISRGEPEGRYTQNDCALRTEDLAGDVLAGNLAGDVRAGNLAGELRAEDLAGDVGFGGKSQREARLIAERDAALSKIRCACMSVCMYAFVYVCLYVG